MSKKQLDLLVGFGALITGGAIYICFRETTHIAVAVRKIPFVNTICAWAQWASCDFVAFYLPDLLWCLALGCFLCLIHGSSLKVSVICATISASFGIVWELLQLLVITSGTADMVDVSMYLVAALFIIIIHLGGKKS